jgi:DNA invertase Pin-like site-specific DNA recombinase
LLIERTMEGLAHARAKGVRLGRPPASEGMEDAIRALRSQKVGWNTIAKELNVGKSVVQRVCQAFDQEQREANRVQ